jgi:hypothetical protein
MGIDRMKFENNDKGPINGHFMPSDIMGEYGGTD